MLVCRFMPMSPHSLIQWIFAFSKSKPTGLFMYTDVVIWERILSTWTGSKHTWEEEREAYILTTTAENRNLTNFPIVNIGEYKRHLPAFPGHLNSCHLGYQDHWISANLASCSQTTGFTFFVPECLLWAITFLFC